MNYNIVSDNFIQENNSRILSGYEIQPRYVSKDVRKNQSNENNTNNRINDFHKRFLMAVYPNQYKMTLTKIFEIAGFTLGTGSRIANECVKKNYVKIIQLPFGRGRPKFPVLLPDGYKVLNVQEQKFCSRGGGYEHTLYQSLITEHFKDHKPKIELNRNGKFIDIGIETNELLIAIEVAMTAVHEKENIEKDFELAKTDFLIIACINEKVKKEVNKILSQFEEHIKTNTEVILISELLKKNPDELLNHQLKMNL